MILMKVHGASIRCVVCTLAASIPPAPRLKHRRVDDSRARRGELQNDLVGAVEPPAAAIGQNAAE